MGRHCDLTTGITTAVAAEGSNHLIKVCTAADGRLRAAGRSDALHAHRRHYRRHDGARNGRDRSPWECPIDGGSDDQGDAR